MPVWFIVILLMVTGLIFTLIEAFVIPGFGIAGLLGLGALSFAIFLSFSKLSLFAGWWISLGSIILVILILKLFRKSFIWRQMILKKTLNRTNGFQSAKNNLKNLVGKSGVSCTALHPSGTILFDGEKIDVVSEGDFIDKNIPVEIIAVAGNKIVVRGKKEE